MSNRTRLTRSAALFALVVALAPAAVAQDNKAALINPVAPAGGPAAPAAGQPGAPFTLDGLLDALDQRGQTLDSFTADVSLAETDVGLALETTRTGKVWYERLPDGTAQFRVSFTEWTDGKVKRAEQVDYVLSADGWLIERNHRLKTQIRRQVLKPGQKMNLLKLGEGPFPLPIGQKKDEVKRQFDAALVKNRKGDPVDAQHLELRPKDGTDLKRRFGQVDVWVDAKTHMPVRVDTLDGKETQAKSTTLTNIVVNPKLGAGDFALPALDMADWTVREEPMK